MYACVGRSVGAQEHVDDCEGVKCWFLVGEVAGTSQKGRERCGGGDSNVMGKQLSCRLCTRSVLDSLRAAVDTV